MRAAATTPGGCWSLYLISRDGDRLYTGVSTDVARRLREHLQGRGARALRGAQRLELVYCCALGERGLALRAERRVKALSRAAKEALVHRQPTAPALLVALALAAEAGPGAALQPTKLSHELI